MAVSFMLLLQQSLNLDSKQVYSDPLIWWLLSNLGHHFIQQKLQGCLTVVFKIAENPVVCRSAPF